MNVLWITLWKAMKNELDTTLVSPYLQKPLRTLEQALADLQPKVMPLSLYRNRRRRRLAWQDPREQNLDAA